MTDDEELLHLFRCDIAKLIWRRAIRQRLLVLALENWQRKPLPESITRLLDTSVEIRD